jgi:hypothetical protein
MAYTQKLTVANFVPDVNHSMELERRLFLCLLPCCLVVSTVPLRSLGGTVAAGVKAIATRQVEEAHVSRRKFARIGWTPATDWELAERWRSFQPLEQIALDVGVSPAAVRNRAGVLGLRQRSQGSIIAL